MMMMMMRRRRRRRRMITIIIIIIIIIIMCNYDRWWWWWYWCNGQPFQSHNTNTESDKNMQERTLSSLKFSANLSETKDSAEVFSIYTDSVVVVNKWGYPGPQPDTVGHPSTDVIEFISECYSPSNTLLVTSQFSYVFQHYATHFIHADQIDLVLPSKVNHSQTHGHYNCKCVHDTYFQTLYNLPFEHYCFSLR